jgi:hypothetical protein
VSPATDRRSATLRCEECGAHGADSAPGWLVLHVRDAEGVDAPFEVVYCPVCAEREFGSGEGGPGPSSSGSA